MHEPVRLAVSNHHGDVNRPNNLNRAKKINRAHGDEIDIYEIDFVSFHGQIVSSHDYNHEMIGEGSPLEEWIAYFVVKKRKILWIDVKENLAIYMACGFERFDCGALFTVLEAMRDRVRHQHPELDLAHYIMIGCQERTLHHNIVSQNRRQHDKRWRVILDSPGVWSYFAQYVTPTCLKARLCDHVCQEFRESNYREYDAISIDQSFFLSRRDIIAFIRSLRLPPETMIIVNSFERDVPALRLANHYIVMQYDYTLDEDVF